MEALLNQKWDTLEKILENRFGKIPDMETILFLIGLQELNSSQTSFNKEEKQDLMHLATCIILSEDHYFKFIENDKDGWPHFKKLKDLPAMSIDEQELFLRKYVILYFEKTGLLNVDSRTDQ